MSWGALRRARSSRLVRHTSWITAAMALRALLQGAYFVLIARTLGAEGYGTFEATLAIIFILVPFASWGTGQLLIMQVARDPATFSLYWGKALLTTLLTSVPLALLTVAVGLALVPNVTWWLLLLLAFAQYIFGRFAETSAQAFQAFERMKAAAILMVLPPLCRFGAVLIFALVSSSSGLERWALLYLVSGIAGALLCLWAVTRMLGRPTFDLGILMTDLRQGMYFSVANAAAGIYGDIDKAMMARLATAQDTGIYTAAYRATYLAFTPVGSLLYTTFARFFRQEEPGIRGTLALARRLLPVAASLGLAASLSLWLVAPILPSVLGSDYLSSVDALRWLAILPLLQALDYLAGDTLSGANLQGLRSVIQAGVIPLNVGLNLLLIPRYSWQGAAWATLLSESTIVIALWAAVRWHVVHEPRGARA